MHNLGWLGILLSLGIGLAEVVAIASLVAATFANPSPAFRTAAAIHGAVAALLLALGFVSFLSERNAESSTSDPWGALGLLVALAVLPALAAIVCWGRARARG